ncbi:MAG TPA: trigger factor [Candidatus Omnitrophota bacterium]|jgi:trigger factor|nr:trigger factor [Candidatus Omnitrophota bacterium]
MKLAVKKIDTLKRELSFEVAKERVAKHQEDIFKEVAKSAKIRGFRPGKAPRNVIETEYGALIKEETIKKVIPEVYQEGIEQEKLAPLDYPQISDVEFKDGQINFKAVIEIKPEVKIANYKGIAVERKSSKVTDEDINKTLEYFKKGQGKDDKQELDDAFVKGLGYPSLEAFKESLARQMEIDKDRQNRLDVEKQITDHLIKAAKLTAPQSLVQKQMDHRVNELKERLKSQGLAEEEIQKREQQITKDLKDAVERDVKLYLIFDKIAELEGMEFKEGESLPVKVMEFLMKEAEWKEGKGK